jgi:hypothetical protein
MRAPAANHGPLVQHTRVEAPVRIELLADPALRQDDAEAVFECLLGRYSGRRSIDGSRSIVIPSRGSGVRGGIKIKGAGLQGSSVRLGKLHSKPYPLPRYDFEGAATVDAAKDHGRAFAGGMSYQQACQEFMVSRYLAERGMRVLASLGYGVLRREGLANWFCLLDAPFGDQVDWWELTRNRTDVARIAAAFGETQLELAEHSVFLTLSGMIDVAGELIRKDFHTAHLAGTNDSFLTRLSYFLFDANFILAHFVHDGYVPDIADHRQLAKVTYLGALTGREFKPDEIDRFKQLLVECKFPPWPMEERIARLAGDEIGRTFLEAFLERSGQKALFGDLAQLEGPVPAHSRGAHPGRLADLFRRK